MLYLLDFHVECPATLTQKELFQSGHGKLTRCWGPKRLVRL